MTSHSPVSSQQRAETATTPITRQDGCQSSHDGPCRGTVEPCARCGKLRCYAEGSSNLSELCNACWSAVVVDGRYWPGPEALRVRYEYWEDRTRDAPLLEEPNVFDPRQLDLFGPDAHRSSAIELVQLQQLDQAEAAVGRPGDLGAQLDQLRHLGQAGAAVERPGELGPQLNQAFQRWTSDALLLLRCCCGGTFRNNLLALAVHVAACPEPLRIGDHAADCNSGFRLMLVRLTGRMRRWMASQPVLAAPACDNNLNNDRSEDRNP